MTHGRPGALNREASRNIRLLAGVFERPYFAGRGRRIVTIALDRGGSPTSGAPAEVATARRRAYIKVSAPYGLTCLPSYLRAYPVPPVMKSRPAKHLRGGNFYWR